VSADLNLNFALRDLVSAQISPRLAPINCARAVEALRHLVAPNLKRNKAWATFRDNLNLDRTYTELLTGISVSHRHGEYIPVSNRDNAEIELRSWTIMNRYLHWRRHGRKRLPLDRFPLLKG
jgi:hypothetical protein